MGGEELTVRAGRHEEEEEVKAGRRGRWEEAGSSGILSGWACTPHGFGAAGKGHVTQRGRAGWGDRARSFRTLTLAEREREEEGYRSEPGYNEGK